MKKLREMFIASALLMQSILPVSALENKLGTITAVGDVMIGRRLTPVIKEKGVEWPFSASKEYLSDADIAFCNLECPISKRGEIIPKEYNFRAVPEAVGTLTDAGFDIVSLANNHCLDYDEFALIDTTATLTENNIKYCGLRNDPVILERDGLKFAFLAYSAVNNYEFDKRKKVSPLSPKQLKQDIAKAKKDNDFVVVSIHFGDELKKSPVAYQKEYAHIAVDSGADLILGHHPHVLQPIEKYHGKYICYSLGNFLFGCLNKIKDSAIVEFAYSKDKIWLERIIPFNVNNYDTNYKPVPLEGKRKQEVIDFLTSGLEEKLK